MAFGVLYVVAFTSFLVGIGVAPNHEFKGRFAGGTIICLLATGLVLALGRL